jgi:hypothetical protein
LEKTEKGTLKENFDTQVVKMVRASEPDLSLEVYQREVRKIQSFATSVIFSAAAVASSTIFLFIPNFETLSVFFFFVGFRYGFFTGSLTVFTSVTIYEIFASQVYGSGGPIPFLLKFPPFFLIMVMGVYFNHLKTDKISSKSHLKTNIEEYESIAEELPSSPLLFSPGISEDSNTSMEFTVYETFLLAQLGLVLTIIYDIITSFGLLVFIPTWEALILSFFTGLPFFLLHQLSNAFLFSTIPALNKALDSARRASSG